LQVFSTVFFVAGFFCDGGFDAQFMANFDSGVGHTMNNRSFLMENTLFMGNTIFITLVTAAVFFVGCLVIVLYKFFLDRKAREEGSSKPAARRRRRHK